MSITVTLHICDSELVCELLNVSTHSRSACRTTILPSLNQDTLLVFLGALEILKLKLLVQYHQRHHATLWNDSVRPKREPIREQGYAAKDLVLRLISDVGQS